MFVFAGAAPLDCSSVTTATSLHRHDFGYWGGLENRNRGLQLIYLLLDRINAGLYTVKGCGLLGCEQIVKDPHLYLRRWVLRAR